MRAMIGFLCGLAAGALGDGDEPDGCGGSPVTGRDAASIVAFAVVMVGIALVERRARPRLGVVLILTGAAGLVAANWR